MKLITSMGAEYFYIVLVLLVFWCVDEKKGLRLGLLIIVSAWVNLTLKTLFNQPRPFNFDPSLGLAFEPSPGLPSGHAQMSLCFWIALAYDLGKNKKIRPIVWPVSIFFILLIGFTRLYLGVHFPTDIFGGWIIAAIILAVFYFVEKPAAGFFGGRGMRLQIIAAAAAALIMNALHPADTSLSALLLGFCAGYSIMKNKFPFFARENTAQNLGSGTENKKPRFLQLAVRFVIGLIGAAVIYLGLRFILPGRDSIFKDIPWLVSLHELGRFIRYGLLGFWASAGAPRIFKQIGLATARKNSANSVIE